MLTLVVLHLLFIPLFIRDLTITIISYKRIHYPMLNSTKLLRDPEADILAFCCEPV